VPALSAAARAGLSAHAELVPLPPDRLDELVAQLCPQPADTDADDIGVRVAFISPDRGQQLAPGHRPARVPDELLQEQELKPGQRHPAATQVRLETADIHAEGADPDHLTLDN